jgi:hypothetical protein
LTSIDATAASKLKVSCTCDIQAGDKFSLFINRRTATTFGLDIPPSLLFTVDKVIE